MTRIKIKTPSLRREVTIESKGNTDQSWTLTMSGFEPREFSANGLHAAIEAGLQLKDGLQPSAEAMAKRAAASARLKMNPIHRAPSAAPQSVSYPATPAEKSGGSSKYKGKGDEKQKDIAQSA